MAGDSLNLGDVLLDALTERLAPRVAEAVIAKLRAEPGFGTPRYATAKNNPCGSRKVFLQGCRDKAFPFRKRGRELSADWADVEAWWKKKSLASAPDADDLFDALKDRVKRRKD